MNPTPPPANLEEALATVEREPTSADNWNHLAIAYLQEGQVEPAINAIGRAIECDPNEPINYSNRGRILFELQRAEESLADYNKAIELAPSAELYASRSVVHMALGKEAAALYDLNDAYDLDPSVKNLLNRAAFFSHKGMASDALRDMSGVVEKEPANPDYRLNRANLAFAQARHQPELYDLGLSDIEEAMNLDQNGVLHSNLLQLADLLEAALDQSPNPTVSRRLIDLIRAKQV